MFNYSQAASDLLYRHLGFCSMSIWQHQTCVHHPGCHMLTKYEIGVYWSHNIERPLFFKIKYGRCRHLEFFKLCTFKIADAFYIGFAISPPNLVRVGRIVNEWKTFFEIQDAAAVNLNSAECAFLTFQLRSILDSQHYHQTRLVMVKQ
jgi:hypothetical protein